MQIERDKNELYSKLQRIRKSLEEIKMTKKLDRYYAESINILT